MYTYEQLSRLFTLEKRAKQLGLLQVADDIFATLLLQFQIHKTGRIQYLILGIEAFERSEVLNGLCNPQKKGYLFLPTIYLLRGEKIVESASIPLPLLNKTAVAFLKKLWQDRQLAFKQRGDHNRTSSRSRRAREERAALIKEVTKIIPSTVINKARGKYLTPNK